MAGDRSVQRKYQSVSEYNGSEFQEVKYSKPHDHLN